ncbi:MAG: Ig-like domain-containing protein [Bacteroidales bacterium]|nr:Ig-like domain-containing protein [Bacteroidales bacterium]
MAALFMLSGCKDDKEAIAVTAVSLDRTTLPLAVGESVTLKATVAPENATDPTVAWSISPTGVATVVDGLVTAKAEGSATITAATANGKKATCAVTVSPVVVAVTGITLLPATLTLSVGEDSTLTVTVAPDNATDPTVTWRSSNAAAATVDNGVVRAVGAGSTTITATSSNGLTDECEVTVVVAATAITLNKPTLSLAVGESETLTATIAPSNATDKTVTWSIDPTGVATVENGLVRAVAEGTATITATSSNGLTDECVVTVTAAGVAATGITLNKATLRLTLGVKDSETLTATVAPENATDPTVIWSSNPTGVVTVVDGLVTAVAEGSATITATTVNGLTDECEVTVGVSGGRDIEMMGDPHIEERQHIDNTVTCGMKFTATHSFISFSVRFVTYGNSTSGITLSLYEWKGSWSDSYDGQTPLLSQPFSNVADYGWQTAVGSSRFPEGDYLWVAHDAVTPVGVRVYSPVEGTQAFWNGAPASESYAAYASYY